MKPELYWRNAKVTKIIDGDTVALSIDAGYGMWLHNERCRLAGINAPEIFGGVQPGGLEAKLWLEREVAKCGGDMLIRTERAKDKWGRWIVWLYVPGTDVSLNQRMIDAGLAKKYED